jgi:hypothetical protein
MTDDLNYEERLSSRWTEALFVALTVAFLLLLILHLQAGDPDLLAGVSFFFFALFLFYSLNFRTLRLRITPACLTLRFGVFTWNVPSDNIGAFRLDVLPGFLRFGGAGIHFYIFRNRYRASFNFLEHPRVMIAFKQKMGLVQELSFSTRQPDEVLRILQEITSP